MRGVPRIAWTVLAVVVTSILAAVPAFAEGSQVDQTSPQSLESELLQATSGTPDTAASDIGSESSKQGDETATGSSDDTYASRPTLLYAAHVQDIGWQTAVSDGQTAGTTGRSLAIEALDVRLSGNTQGTIEVNAHVQDVGWQGYRDASAGSIAGTTGQSKRVEAVQVRLDGSESLTNAYDVWYRVHVQNIGWLGWTKNGATAGTTGLCLRVEAIELKLLPKGDSAPGSTSQPYLSLPEVSYRAHVQDVGWQDWGSSGSVAGTTGQNKRIEALEAIVSGEGQTGEIQINAHVQDVGWQGWTSQGEIAGTTGQSRRVEALRVRLTESLESCDVWYRVHVQDLGWMGWAKNGESAGTTGCCARIEALQIVLKPKGAAAPGSTQRAFTSDASLFAPQVVQYYPVYYRQGDPRWGGRYFGGRSMAASGCVPTACAMAISGIKGMAVTPLDVANYLWNGTAEFNRSEGGASGLATALAAQHWGVAYSSINGSDSALNALGNGKIVVIAVGRGTFVHGNYTHAIVLFGRSGESTHVYDPETPNRNGWYNARSIWSQRSSDPYDWRGGYVAYALG